MNRSASRRGSHRLGSPKGLIDRPRAAVSVQSVFQRHGEDNDLNEVLVQTYEASDGSSDLSCLHRVGEPGAEVVVSSGCEDLGLGGQAAERLRMNDAISIALELRSS